MTTSWDSPTPIETPYALSPSPGVSLEVEPVLTVDGYPLASRADATRARNERAFRRQVYWTEGDGARRFLEEVATKLNASPHMKLQPFEVTMSWGIRASILNRITEFMDHDDHEIAEVVLGYADEVALGLLAELTRSNRWEDAERIGRKPVPLNYPTYTAGQSHRAGPFDYVIGRKSQAVASEELERFRLENPWVK